MPVFKIRVNNKEYEVKVPGNKPLLWVLREELGLTGTKYGCGIGYCGACTIHLNGSPARACGLTVSSLNGAGVTTIEGLAHPDHPLIRAWEMEKVPQCGYCQAGQLMSAAILLRQKSMPTDKDIDRAMQGTLCRCGTYYRIRKAIKRALTDQS